VTRSCSVQYNLKNHLRHFASFAFLAMMTSMGGAFIKGTFHTGMLCLVILLSLCIDPGYIVVSSYSCSKNFRVDIIDDDGTINKNQYLLHQHHSIIHVPIETRERLNASFCQVLCLKPDFRVLLAQTPAEVIPLDQERRRQRPDQQIYVPPARRSRKNPSPHNSQRDCGEISSLSSTWDDRGRTGVVMTLVL